MKALLMVGVACGMMWGADLTVGSATAPCGRKATGFISLPAVSDAGGDDTGESRLTRSHLRIDSELGSIRVSQIDLSLQLK